MSGLFGTSALEVRLPKASVVVRYHKGLIIVVSKFIPITVLSANRPYLAFVLGLIVFIAVKYNRQHHHAQNSYVEEATDSRVHVGSGDA